MEKINIIKNQSSFFLSLIDRLKTHSEWKYPNRLWNDGAYYNIAWEWVGKEQELLERVINLEKVMYSKGREVQLNKEPFARGKILKTYEDVVDVVFECDLDDWENYAAQRISKDHIKPLTN